MKAFMEKELESEVLNQKLERELFEQRRTEFESQYPLLKNKTFDEIKNELLYHKKIKNNLGITKCKKEVADLLANAYFQGRQRVARLMEKEIPGYNDQIRESVRPDPKSIGHKIGTPLIYGTAGTSWHNVLVVNDQGVKLMPYKNIKDPVVASYTIGDHTLPYIMQ